MGEEGARALAGGYNLDWSGICPLGCRRVGDLTYGLDNGWGEGH